MAAVKNGDYYSRGKLIIEGNWFYVDNTGKQAFPRKFKEAQSFLNGRARVTSLSGKVGFIDKTGKETIPVQYTKINEFKNGIAIAEKDKKFGFVDKTGKEIIPPKYDKVSNYYASITMYELSIPEPEPKGKFTLFNEGLAIVKFNGKYGYIDTAAKEVIRCKYDFAKNFENGTAKVRVGENVFYIDKKGRKIK